MLFYSHIWDGVLKLTTLVGFILLAVHFELDQRIHPVALMIGIVAAMWILLYRQYLSILSSWLYGLLSLRTNVPLRESEALCKRVQLDVSGSWVPGRSRSQLPMTHGHS